MMVSMASSNTILQTIAEEDKRGRLMSLYTMAFAGVAPFGSLLAGTLSTRIGAPATLTIGGCVCLVGAGLFALQLPQLRALVRPIYSQKGILPPWPLVCRPQARSRRPRGKGDRLAVPKLIAEAQAAHGGSS